MECPDLLSCRNDLFRWKEEAVSSSVSQLHRVAVGNTQLSQCPVKRASTGNIEHAGNAANLVCLLVNSIESIVTSLCNSKNIDDVVLWAVGTSPTNL